MYFSPTIIIGLGVLAVVALVIAINLNYYNKPNLKFHNDEIDVSDVKFEHRNILMDN